MSWNTCRVMGLKGLSTAATAELDKRAAGASQQVSLEGRMWDTRRTNVSVERNNKKMCCCYTRIP